MRLRNIPRADEYIAQHKQAVSESILKEHKGQWNNIFGNENPICIEIGMGKGQFILNLAKRNPNINYIGVERYSSVLLRALEKFDSEEFCELTNIRFICMDARGIADVFEKGEIKKIFLNFSDPWPKARHASRRLPSRQFLARYAQVLEESGTVEFKTDNKHLFEFAIEEVREVENWELIAYTFDLHQNQQMNAGNVMTEYEEKFSKAGNPIHKLIIKQVTKQTN